MPVVSATSAIDTVAWEKDETNTRHVGELGAPKDPILNYVPRIFKFDRAPIEATGLSVDIYARANILMSSLFLGPALLHLASNEAEANCLAEGNFVDGSTLMDACMETAKVHGFKPSSLLSNIAVVAGLFGALILPPFGAIVDYTSYRKHVGMISAALLTIVKGIEITISADTWFFIACLQIVSGILYSIHLASIYAYTSELSENPDDQTRFNVFYFVVMYFGTLVFMVEVLLFAYLLDASDVGTARIAMIITTVTCVILFSIAWRYLFRHRPPLNLVEDGKTILLSGFVKLYRTSKRIQKDLPALRWFMLSLVFSESANMTLVTIATTYMSHFLKMNGKDIGAVFLTVLVMGIPGSKLGEFLALRLNPVSSAKICDILYIIVTSVAAMTLTGPDRAHLTVIFGGLWGICLGWLHPIHTTIFVTIRPSGQDAEMMSLYLFCVSAFTWLPPLVFTLINEHGVHITWGLASLNIFFFLGLVCLFCMGNYQQAIFSVRPPEDTEEGNLVTGKAGGTVNATGTYGEEGSSNHSGEDEVELRALT